MSHDVQYDEKNASDLERRSSSSGGVDGGSPIIEELGAGAASKESGILAKVNELSFFLFFGLAAGGGLLFDMH